ncbi:GNAT family N-acetyltransferase [uncultured Peptoniphilus sp.]|uniref:GNAT family N-acetyltransferase n=1 Tax=uncultured Peptoniphilus sp. TaxID=254354 RepID=UPI0028064B35|nr:GNAT family N-acetyltransferase [uncultured Peptoniphilus sp.]
MKIQKFKDKKELKIIESYRDLFSNDYLKGDYFLENFNNLYYMEGKNLYILVKRDGYFETYFYIRDFNEKLPQNETFLAEIVTKNPENLDLQGLGFEKYKIRERLRLRKKEDFYCPKVVTLRDENFILEGLNTFDKYSGERLSLDEIREKIKNEEFIGIENAGFLEYQKGKFQDLILHFYVHEKYRNKGYGKIILRHYLSNIADKKRINVWTDKDSRALKIYEACGFKREELYSQVLIGGKYEGKN